jgi:hypothetical protein
MKYLIEIVVLIIVVAIIVVIVKSKNTATDITSINKIFNTAVADVESI